MLAQGKCSPTEFARMVLEKQQALSLSGFALLRGASAASILAPFHRGATANAKRLCRTGNRQRVKGADAVVSAYGDDSSQIIGATCRFPE